MPTKRALSHSLKIRPYTYAGHGRTATAGDETGGTVQTRRRGAETDQNLFEGQELQ